jgi:hypothetical protein
MNLRESFWLKNIHICAAESEPVNEMTAVRIPTSADVPSLFHPPPLLKVVKTSFAFARGARVQRGIKIAKKPAIWIRSRIASTSGNFLARNVLKKMENAATAIISSVAWYGWGTKVGWLRMIRASIS